MRNKAAHHLWQRKKERKKENVRKTKGNLEKKEKKK
jgi:hypothetical protein